MSDRPEDDKPPLCRRAGEGRSEHFSVYALLFLVYALLSGRTECSCPQRAPELRRAVIDGNKRSRPAGAAPLVRTEEGGYSSSVSV